MRDLQEIETCRDAHPCCKETVSSDTLEDTKQEYTLPVTGQIEGRTNPG